MLCEEKKPVGFVVGRAVMCLGLSTMRVLLLLFVGGPLAGPVAVPYEVLVCGVHLAAHQQAVAGLASLSSAESL